MTALVNKIKINVKQIFEYQILHFDKCDQHDLTEILMKVALNTKPLHPPFIYMDTSKLYYPIGKETLAPYSVI
jgi:hypothetical protein